MICSKSSSRLNWTIPTDQHSLYGECHLDEILKMYHNNSYDSMCSENAAFRVIIYD